MLQRSEVVDEIFSTGSMKALRVNNSWRYRYLVGVNSDSHGVFVILGDFTEDMYEACHGEASAAGLSTERLVVVSRLSMFCTDDVTWVRLSDVAPCTRGTALAS